VTGVANRDVLALYAQAGETGDAELVASLFAENGTLRSPIFGRFVFRGREDLRKLMSVVYRAVKDTEFTRRAREGRTAMLTGSSRVWGFRIEEAFAFDLNEQGEIETVTIHIRPLLGLTVLMLALGVGMSRHPGVILRAARGASR
jgi:hypothetical protein